MSILIKIKKWFNKNKKYVLISGTVIFTVGASIAYVIYKKGKISFDEWVKIASTDELKDAYEKYPKSYNPNLRWSDANRWDKD